jgi:phage/plasmid-associated DNA primase
VCGAVSGNLLVLDFDNRDMANEWAKKYRSVVEGAPIVKTGRENGGFHLFVKTTVPVACGKNPFFDIKGEGGYVVGPGSTHPSGQRYEVKSGDMMKIPTIDPVLLGLEPPDATDGNGKGKPKGWQDDILGKDIPEGERHGAMVSLVGRRIARGDTRAEVEAFARGVNVSWTKPLPIDEILQIIDSLFKTHERKHEPRPESAIALLWETAHGTAADVLFEAFEDRIVFERTSLDGRGEFFQRVEGACYYESFPRIREVARGILEDAISRALEAVEKETTGKAIKDLYSAAGKAKVKARTKDFISSALFLLSDRFLIFPSIPWNATPQCIPTLDNVVDFSGAEPVMREVRAGEYFRDPAPCTARGIIDAHAAPKFEAYLATLFSNPQTAAAIRSCLGACIANHATKTFYVWTNPEGDGGKNTLFEFLRELIPGRIGTAKNALILYKGDSSERRFGEIELQGKSGVFFDEVGGWLDIAQIKRYTGLSTIRGEAKGRDSVEFKQTWALVVMCNELAKFFPANDGAFLSRLFVIPFSSVFYADEDDHRRRIGQGIPEARLKPAREQKALLAEILQERPAIIRSCIMAWIDSRQRSGRPASAPECEKAKETYRASNDLAEQFFDEYLVKAENDAVPYDTIKAAWREFFGAREPNMKEIVAALTKRFLFITPGKSHGVRNIKGVALNKDPEEPSEDRNGNVLPFDRDSKPPTGEKRGARGTEMSISDSPLRNQDFSMVSEKTGSQSPASPETPEHPDGTDAPTTPPPDVEETPDGTYFN